MVFEISSMLFPTAYSVVRYLVSRRLKVPWIRRIEKPISLRYLLLNEKIRIPCRYAGRLHEARVGKLGAGKIPDTRGEIGDQSPNAERGLRALYIEQRTN